MPFKDPDPTDPNMLVGVMLSADAEATRDMAYVFAEEFARLGYTREQLLWLFKNPFYGGAHGAYRSLGENETLSIIDECLSAWGHARFSILDFGFSIAEDHCHDSASGGHSAQGGSLTYTQIKTAEHPSESDQSKIENRKSKIGEGGGCDE
jgi:hypothetical protein